MQLSDFGLRSALPENIGTSKELEKLRITSNQIKRLGEEHLTDSLGERMAKHSQAPILDPQALEEGGRKVGRVAWQLFFFRWPLSLNLADF